MKWIPARAYRYASKDMPVLITGETGAGKELIARAIHDAGRRAGRQFVVVDCAAIPASLLGNELFGHERGSTRTPTANNRDSLPRRTGGSLFLDEIGELPLATQSALLRVLSEGTYRPLGSVREVSSDVRVIAATNRDLQEAVARGAFRVDLYYRIRSAVIDLPPLRSRPVDIPPLIRHFIRQLHPSGVCSPVAMARLTGHGWKGNVRELQNRVESAVSLAKNGMITVEDFFPENSAGIGRDDEMLSLYAFKDDVFRDSEKDCLVCAMRMTRGNMSKAANIAGMHRTYLYHLCRRHRVKPSDFRKGG